MGQAIMPHAFDPAATPERMAAWIMQFSPISDAEALKLLRARYPDRPLSLRVAAGKRDEAIKTFVEVASAKPVAPTRRGRGA